MPTAKLYCNWLKNWQKVWRCFYKLIADLVGATLSTSVLGHSGSRTLLKLYLPLFNILYELYVTMLITLNDHLCSRRGLKYSQPLALLHHFVWYQLPPCQGLQYPQQLESPSGRLASEVHSRATQKCLAKLDLGLLKG